MLSKFTTLTMLAATWVVVAAVPAGAQAQTARMRFESMDQNRDGVISRDEWRGSDRAFQNQDWNGDGQLSGNEVRIGARRDGNYEEADHLPNRYERYVSWTTAGFNNLDHNRDRRISANEWHFDLETFRRVDRNRDGSLSQSEFLGGDIDDARDASFDDLDWNNNGRVERSEWNGSDSVFTSLDRNRDGVLSRFEVVGGVNTPNDTWDEFASLDYNRNGAISRDEWHWSAASFDRRDTNRDGRLSRQEFAVSGGAPGAVGTSGGAPAAHGARQLSTALDRLGHRRACRRYADAGRERDDSDERRRRRHGESRRIDQGPQRARCSCAESARGWVDRAD